ncbi:hypothetical protein BH24ACT26_BH24ACT26_17220 [soil metagenome]
MSAATVAGALAQLVVLGLVGWVVGDALLGALPAGTAAGRRAGASIEWPERALAAIAGFVAFALALMVAHIVTGGAAFGVPGVVPAAALVLLWRRWRRTGAPEDVPWVRVALAVALLAAIYSWPALAGGSGLRVGDIPWHMGWTEQLLAGEPVPTGPAPRFGANAYPWGFHAVVATMVRAVPGSSPAVAVEALGFLLSAAIPLSAACLARRLRPDAGWWGAAAAAGIGGFGWLQAQGPHFDTTPSEAPFGADLVVASPNAVYELFPPGLPRELGLVLLGAAGMLVAVSLRSSGRRAGIVPGIATGLVGLMSVPTFVSASLWALLAVACRPRRDRLRWLLVVALVAGAIFALWAGPVASRYLRFGGFVNITPELGMEWPLGTALGSWGLLVPAALGGAIVAGRSASREARAALLWALGATLLLALARARAQLDWDLAGNATLLHQGRVWPVAHLLASSLAGVGLAWAHGALARRSSQAAAAGAALVLGVGAMSPVVASMGLTETLERHDGGFIYGRPDIAPGSFVRRAADHLDPDDVVRVEDARLLGFLLWQFSGARLAAYDDPRLDRNDLRIRFRDLAGAWDRRMASGGFEADYAVVPAGSVRRGASALERGRFMGVDWALVPE